MNIDSLKDIAPTLVGDYTCEDTPEVIFKKYYKTIENYKQYMGLGNKYFFGHLHDSHILSCRINEGNLDLKLNEIATLQFACALVDKMKLKINMRKIIFPLEIISENTKHLSLNIVGKKGKVYENDFVELNQYICEEIIKWTENNVRIAFNLWSDKVKYKFGDNVNCRNYLLLLSCDKLTINEKQHENWNKYFGNKYDKYYNLFLEERKKDKYLSDYSQCEKFIEEIM